MFSRRQAAQNAAKSAEGVVVPVVQARSLGADVLADVAARYGVQISAGARAVAVPRGAAGQVWRPNKLASLVLVRPSLVVDGAVVAPGGAVGAEAYRKGVGRVRAAAKGGVGRADMLAKHARLQELHAAGMTDKAMAGVLGWSPEYVAVLRRGLELVANVAPTVVEQRLGDAAFMGRVRGLVTAGKGMMEMAGLLGVNRHMLRDLLERAELLQCLPRKAVVQKVRRAREGHRMEPFKGQILEQFKAGVAVLTIAQGLKVRRNAVDRALLRWGAKARPDRVMNMAAVAARNEGMVARLEAGEVPAAVAASLGLSEGRVARLWREARRGAGVAMWVDEGSRMAAEAALRAEDARGIGVDNLMMRHGMTRRQVLAVLQAGAV